MSEVEGDSLPLGVLVRATEAIGLVSNKDLAVPVLLRRLSHVSPVVQEAAVYGLERHLDGNTRQALTEKLQMPTLSRGVRQAIEEAIGEG